MKILAIRGQNLASLAAQFEIDLRVAPLSGEGLFAITGQTGSGKSTLLDAMCLALFDKTPRLSKGGARIGRDEDDKERQAGSNDPRTVLRRGAGSGHAEVEFLGVDKRVYRSRWTARRARNKAEGRLRPAVMELVDVETGKALGSDKKSVTLREIEKRLGLDFEQFRRSVLLPQGEFAAFLKADEEKRGALLERMTGTRIYRDISIAAFQRARDEKQALSSIEDKLSVLSLLSDERRETLQQEIETALRTEQALSATVERLEQAVSWFERLEHLQDALHNAQRDKESAAARCTQLVAVVQEVAAVRAAHALRPRFEQASIAQEAHAKATQQSISLEAECVGAEQAMLQSHQDVVDAQMALQKTRAAFEQITDELSQAAALDGELASLGRVVAQALREGKTATLALTEATEAVNVLQETLEQARQEQQIATTWLGEHAHFIALSRHWDRLSRDVRQAVATAREQAEVQAALPAVKASLQRVQPLFTSLRDALSSAETAVATHRAQVEALRASWAESAEASLQTESRQLYLRRQRLEQLSTKRQLLLDLVGRQSALVARIDSAKTASGVAAAVAEQADEQRTQLGWMLTEAERFLEQVRANEVLQDRRGALKEGEPCPLCGATAHPWAGQHSPPVEIFQMQIQRVEELRSQRSDVSLRAEQSRRDVVRLSAEIHSAQQATDELIPRIEALEAEWLAAAEGLHLPAYADAEAAIVAAMVSTDQALADIEERLKKAAALRGQITAVEQARDAEMDAAAQARRQLQDVRTEQQSLHSEQERLQKRKTSLDEQWSVCVEELQGTLEPFGDWKDALVTDGDAFWSACARDVDMCTNMQQRQQVASQQINTIETQLEKAQARQEERAALAHRLKADSVERRTQLDALQNRRALLLGGEDTTACRDRHRQQVDAAESLLAAQLQVHERAKQHHTQRSARLAAARLEAQQRTAEAKQAQDALHEALGEQQISLAELQQRLQRSTEWLTAQQQDIDEANAHSAQAEAILTERQRQRDEHRSQTPEMDDIAQTKSALSDATGRLEAIRKNRYELQAECSTDDSARAQASALLGQRDEQRRISEHWDVMNKLIGSATGKNFSQFAQSLTLDAMLVQANQHLKGLSQRYALMRVPGEDLVLQIVDHYQGDEVRSVNSLSGGESFLVSLALALGLATLSAKDTHIGSLFIDEGFGTLDPDTLDVALSSLDALQASGRQVGLISHVPGMTERIGVQIQVVPRGGGRSSIRIVG